MLLSHKFKQDGKFTSAEQSVIDYIMSNPQVVIQSTIKELAHLTNSSPTTILRICKKVDLEGFTELKIKLATEFNSFSLDNFRIEVVQPIPKDIPDEEIPKQFLNLHYQALTDTYNTIDFSRVFQAAHTLTQASSITIVGTGESLILGSDFHYKLLRIGKRSDLELLEGFQLSKIWRLNDEDTVALVISQYGRSNSVLRSIKTLSRNNIKSILITSARQNPMIPYATLPIIIDNSETHTKMGSFASRTAILYVLDCIYAIIFKNDYDASVQKIMKYYEARKI